MKREKSKAPANAPLDEWREQTRSIAQAAINKAADKDEGPPYVVLSNEGEYFLKRENAGTFEGPFKRSNVARARLREIHRVSSTFEFFKGNPPHLRNLDDIVSGPGLMATARTTIRDFRESCTTFDGVDTLTIGYELPTITPVFNVHVENWFRELAGGSDDDLADLVDWVVSCQQRYLNQRATAAVLLGQASAGKSVFALALGRMWGATVVPFRFAARQFNNTLARCPIVFDDESQTLNNPRKEQRISSKDFREIVQRGEHDLEPKGQETRALLGYLRILIAANSYEDLNFSDGVTGADAMSALKERLSVFDSRGRVDNCKAAYEPLMMPGTSNLDLDKVCQHIAHLWATVKPRPTDRFLGKRTADSGGAERMLAAQSIALAPEVFDNIHHWLEADPEQEGKTRGGLVIARRKQEPTIGVRLSTFAADAWAERNLRDALTPFLAPGDGARDWRVAGADGRFWALDLTRVVKALGVKERRAIRRARAELEKSSARR